MPKKIFELAKDLGMNALDLVEDLKQKGFAVRNHMSEVSDEDANKIQALFKPAAPVEDSAPKKKVIKKKAAAPKAGDAAVETSAKEEDKAASTAKKKSTVIRRKGGEEADAPAHKDEIHFNLHDEVASIQAHQAQQAEDAEAKQQEQQEEVLEAAQEENVAEEQVVEEVVETPVQTPAPAKKEERSNPNVIVRSGGLRVVSRPEKMAPQTPVPVPEAKVEVRKAADIQEKKSELYKEKVHRFTPVFIPPKVEKKEEENKGVQAKKRPPVTGTPAVAGPHVVEAVDDEDANSKKRLGGLATMMSGKVKVASRALLLNEEKTEEELKTYSLALSSLGKPIYTQMRKKKVHLGPSNQTMITEVKESKRVLQLHGGVTIEDLAQKLSVKLSELTDKVLEINLLVKADDYIGVKLAAQIAALYNYRVEDKAFDEKAVIGTKATSTEEKEKWPLRSPVVTIMGHVDHGKTSLLDYIRKAKVAAGEAGGITQHIGAYQVNVADKVVTFLDTPGHAAFASMRLRGAQATDIVVLVVAADDGVMPQTKESVKFCEQAGVPIIVAINKMDKPGVNPDRVKKELTELNLLPEEWGGQVQCVGVSALTGDGVDNLLEAITVQAEIMELRSNPKGAAEGIVIESKIEPGRGPIATILVKTGTLTKGDSIVVGETCGRARSLMDHLGNQLKDAGPSTPVQILGLEEVPMPGDIMNVVKNEREARKIVENRINEKKLLAASPSKKTVTLEDFFSAAPVEGSEKKILNLVIRSDVQGSYEAVRSAAETLGNNEVGVKVIGGGVGAITDNDVLMAASSGGIIIGFNMRPVTTARRLAEERGVEIKTYSIIYELVNEIKLALEGLLTPEFAEEYCGRAEIRETFVIPKIGTIAGCLVVDGKINRGCSVRLLRDGKIIHDGKLSSLKRFKDDVKEVSGGYECGMGLESFNDLKVGDLFEAYNKVEKRRKLEDVAGSNNATL